MPHLDLLRSHLFTQGMPESMLRNLAMLARELKFEPDQIVFRARDDAYQLGLVLSGSFRVELGTAVYAVSIQTLGPGEVFGWSATLDHRYSFFQIRALERSRALCIDGAKLADACSRDAELAAEVYRRIAQVAARRVQAVERRLAEFYGTKMSDADEDPSASTSAA
jgi:CRP-like cAMP-binding protein